MLNVVNARGKNKAPRTKRGAEEGYSFHTVVKINPEGGTTAKRRQRDELCAWLESGIPGGTVFPPFGSKEATPAAQGKPLENTGGGKIISTLGTKLKKTV